MLEYSIQFPCYAAHKLLEEALGKSTAELAGKSSSINCIVTSGSLVPSIAKCLLYRLDDVVSSDNGSPLMLSQLLFDCFICVAYCKLWICYLKYTNGNKLSPCLSSLQLVGIGEAAVLQVDQGTPRRPECPLLRGWRRPRGAQRSFHNEMAVRQDRDPPRRSSQVPRPEPVDDPWHHGRRVPVIGQRQLTSDARGVDVSRHRSPRRRPVRW